MAYNGAAAAFFFIAVLIAAASTQGQSLTLQGITVSGSLCCTPTGNCPGQGVSGVPVSLNCSLIRVSTFVPGSNTTNVNGTFTITVPRVKGVVRGHHLPLLPCFITVQLPLSNRVCPALSSATGILVSAIRTDGTVLNTAIGAVQNASLDGFFNLPP